MLKPIAQIFGGLLVALVGLWVLFTLAMRTKFRPVQDAVRRMNRAVLNPRTMETAGRPRADASVIRHVGRTTGNPYQTPVQALATDDGFVIPLPYGTRADWLQNVLATGSAIIVNDGTTFRVDRPELISRAVAASHVPTKSQWAHRLYGVDQFLLVRTEDLARP